MPLATTGPGALLATLIHKVTGETPGPNCSCNKRAAQMNEWGWRGCIKNRKQIVGWLVQEAEKRGHPVSRAKVLGLLKAAIRESREK